MNSMFLGHVEEVISDDLFEIRFSVPLLFENLETYPKAFPLFENTNEINKGDFIFIIQPNKKIESFFYHKLPNKKFSGIKYGNKKIDFKARNVDSDMDDDYSLEINNSANEENPRESVALTEDLITLSSENGSIELLAGSDGKNILLGKKSGDNLSKGIEIGFSNTGDGIIIKAGSTGAESKVEIKANGAVSVSTESSGVTIDAGSGVTINASGGITIDAGTGGVDIKSGASKVKVGSDGVSISGTPFIKLN